MKKRLVIVFAIILVVIIAVGVLHIMSDKFTPSILPDKDKAIALMGENDFMWYDDLVSQVGESKYSEDSKPVVQDRKSVV